MKVVSWVTLSNTGQCENVGFRLMLCWFLIVALILLWLRWYFIGYVGVRYLTPYFGYIIFYPHVSECNALLKEVPKGIIQKEKTGQIRDEDVSFILSFINWVQQPFHG